MAFSSSNFNRITNPLTENLYFENKSHLILNPHVPLPIQTEDSIDILTEDASDIFTEGDM